MNKKQIIICSLAALLGVGSLKAQNTSSTNNMAPEELPYQEIAVSIYGPGINAMPFKGDAEWTSKPSYTLGFGADYTYWFNRNVGIVAGLKFSYLNNCQESEAFQTDVHGTLTVKGIGYTHANIRTNTVSVTENRTMSFIEVPLRLALTKKDAYLNVGFSLATALTSYATYSYSTTTYAVNELTDMGVTLPSVPVTFTEDRSGNTFQNSDVSNPFFVLLAAEAGYKFKFDDINAVSLGLYGRYAITKSNPDGGNQVFMLNNDRISVNQPSATSLVEKIGYYEFGLRIAYHYGVGKKKTYF